MSRTGGVATGWSVSSKGIFPVSSLSPRTRRPRAGPPLPPIQPPIHCPLFPGLPNSEFEHPRSIARFPYNARRHTHISQDFRSFHSFRSFPSLSYSLSFTMRSFTSFLVPALSFVSLVAASPLPSTTYPTHLTKNAISSRQYRYPRALVDVCADVDLSVIVDDLLGLDLGLLGDICLCLSAFPLKVDLDADVSLLSNLLGGIDASVEALLHTAVRLYVLLISRILTLFPQGRRQRHPVYLSRTLLPCMHLRKPLRLHVCRRLCSRWRRMRLPPTKHHVQW